MINELNYGIKNIIKIEMNLIYILIVYYKHIFNNEIFNKENSLEDV